MSNKNITKSVKCSFCGKPQEMVKRIVAGPNAYICDECIAICNNIIEDENYDEETGYEDLKSEDILPVLREAADFVLSYEGEIPGYSPRDCGNYLDNNLNLAKIYMRKFKQEVLDNPAPERLVYPQ